MKHPLFVSVISVTKTPRGNIPKEFFRYQIPYDSHMGAFYEDFEEYETGLEETHHITLSWSVCLDGAFENVPEWKYKKVETIEEIIADLKLKGEM